MSNVPPLASLMEKLKTPSREAQRLTRDLLAEAQAGRLAPVSGREQEIEDMLEILNQQRKANVMLIGPAGAGKTAVVEGLARLFHRHGRRLPGRLHGVRLEALSGGDLVAGAGVVGELESRLKALFETGDSARRILFIDEIHTLFGAGAGGQSQADVANLLKPYLARGDLRVIGATTEVEYSQIVAKDAAFERRFTPVMIAPLGEDATVDALLAYSRYRGVASMVDRVWLETLVRQSKRFLPARTLPDSAMDVFERALSLAELHGRVPDAVLREQALLRAARLPRDLPSRLAALGNAEPVAQPLVKTLTDYLAGTAKRSLFASLEDASVGARVAEALGEALGGLVEIDLASDSSEDLLGAAPGLVGYGDRRPLHALLEQPFRLLWLRGYDEAGPHQGWLERLRREGVIRDREGRIIPAPVVLATPSPRACQPLGFMPSVGTVTV